jgi:phenylalanyl-tRNA synthetase beta chain
LHEVHSYIWSDVQKNRELGIETPENVRIINAQTPDHKYIRVSMIPTLLSFAKENKSYSDNFGIFEIGHIVDGFKENGYCNEEKKLGCVLYSKSEGEEELFMKAADIISELTGDILHEKASFKAKDVRYDFEHPANTFAVSVMGVEIGTLSVPHPVVTQNIDKKCAVAFFEIYTEKFASIKSGTTEYKEPSKFPAIDIDITFNEDASSIDFEKLTADAKATAGEILSDVKLKDIYTAEDGTTAVTIRFSFVSNERTLTKQELAPETEKIISALGMEMKM